MKKLFAVQQALAVLRLSLIQIPMSILTTIAMFWLLVAVRLVWQQH